MRTMKTSRRDHEVSQSPWDHSGPKAAMRRQPGGRWRETSRLSALACQPVALREPEKAERPVAVRLRSRRRTSTPSVLLVG